MTTPSTSTLRVFTFDGGFGLPTLGPFALKLLTWLRLAGIPYEQVIENDPRKGPKGKNPWIELEGERLGDTELILERLRERFGVDLDGWLDPQRAATGLALQRMVEEHLHQVFEYELIVMDAGFAHMRDAFKSVPAPLRPIVTRAFRGHFRKQLHARGIGRHSDADRTRMGCRDLDAIAALIAGAPWALGARPTTTDATLYGFLAPMMFSPLPTPVMSYARAQPSLAAYCRRVRSAVFEQNPDGALGLARTELRAAI